MECNYLSIPPNRLSLEMDNQYYPTLYWACAHLTLLPVNKRGHWTWHANLHHQSSHLYVAKQYDYGVLFYHIIMQ